MATTKVGLFQDRRKQRPWVVRWFGEYDPATDKQKRYSKSFRLKRDAESLKARKQAEFDRGAQRDRPPTITLKAFCDKYMARRKHEWAEKTRQHIEDLTNRLIDHFGVEVPLGSVTPDKASKFWSQAAMVRCGQVGQELSRYTRNRLLRDAKTIFRYAVLWGHVATNPFDGIRPLRVAKQHRRCWHYVSPDDYQGLLKAAPTLRWKIFYALAYTSAARFGELFNLTEGDVDLERGRLLIRSRPGTESLPPFRVKDHEDRRVPLPRHAVRLVQGLMRTCSGDSPLLLLSPQRYQTVLKRWHRHRVAGEPWVNDYLVNNVIREVRRHAKWAGLTLDGALTVHCFRKSCAQNWADHLPMNVVKELMGHSDISTTAQFYSTVTEDHETQAQWVTEAVVLGRSQNKNDARLTPGTKTGSVRKVG